MGSEEGISVALLGIDTNFTSLSFHATTNYCPQNTALGVNNVRWCMFRRSPHTMAHNMRHMISRYCLFPD